LGADLKNIKLCSRILVSILQATELKLQCWRGENFHNELNTCFGIKGEKYFLKRKASTVQIKQHKENVPNGRAGRNLRGCES
jgi:hypothetical protein